MDVRDAIVSRRSVRKYLPIPVEEEKLTLVLDAARLAPSAKNDQNWHFVVVQDEEKKKLLYEAAFEQEWVLKAPCVIVACAVGGRKMACNQPTDTVNLSIAMSFMLLQAQELGLGTCWLGLFDAGKVSEALDIPEGVTVVALTPLGYPEHEPKQRPRKELCEIVSREKY